MPHARDQIVTAAAFEAEIQKLESLFDELGIEISEGSDLATLTRRSFVELYYATFINERPATSNAENLAEGSVVAGLGDVATKINRARKMAGFDTIRAHLLNMVRGAVRMDAASSVTDDAANKNSELYVGCLALGAGMAVELEDPVNSGGGKNPDVLLTHDGKDWSIAVKACHSAKAPTIFGNISKAVEQIERSDTSGIVFVNLKNIVDHEGLIKSSPFPDVDVPRHAVTAQAKQIGRSIKEEIVKSERVDLFAGKRAVPLVALMVQVTLSAHTPANTVNTFPVRVLHVVDMRTDPDEEVTLSPIDKEAWDLLSALNEQLQKQPPS